MVKFDQFYWLWYSTVCVPLSHGSLWIIVFLKDMSIDLSYNTHRLFNVIRRQRLLVSNRMSTPWEESTPKQFRNLNHNSYERKEVIKRNLTQRYMRWLNKLPRYVWWIWMLSSPAILFHRCSTCTSTRTSFGQFVLLLLSVICAWSRKNPPLKPFDWS